MKNVSTQKVQLHIAGCGCQRFIIFADNVKPPFPYLISSVIVTQQGTRHRTIIPYIRIRTHTYSHACVHVYLSTRIALPTGI